ncbi:MAG: hypothetical protein OSB34_11440, partial [Planktomarina sp.]|nr:hypothetical protein [Planktomarina sp.]
QPNAKSANPITIGKLQGGRCLARGPRSTRRVTEYRIQVHWLLQTHGGHQQAHGTSKAYITSQRLISSITADKGQAGNPVACCEGQASAYG